MTAISVPIAAANTNYSLLTLLKAVDSTIVDLPGPWTVRADEGNTIPVLVGGASLSSSQYAGQLVAGESIGVKSLLKTYVRASNTGTLVSVSRSI